jgi:hypothetical protein
VTSVKFANRSVQQRCELLTQDQRGGYGVLTATRYLTCGQAKDLRDRYLNVEKEILQRFCQAMLLFTNLRSIETYNVVDKAKYFRPNGSSHPYVMKLEEIYRSGARFEEFSCSCSACRKAAPAWPAAVLLIWSGV